MLFSNLRAIPVAVGGAPAYKDVFLHGGEFLADNLGGFFTWNSTSTDADDNLSWLKPDSLTESDMGRWQRIRYVPAYGTTAGTICQGNDSRLPTTTEREFLATISMSGDDFTITPGGTGKITIASNLRVEGSITIFDGINTKVITATST